MAVIHYVPYAIAAGAPDPVVLIISSAYSSLPAPGNRVGPSDATNMPTIQASTGNPAFVTATGAHHYRLVGLNIKAPTTLLQTAVVKIGGGETTLSEFPTDITVDRCIVKGDTTAGVRRGVSLDGIRCAIVDSYVYDVKDTGGDTQAVWAYNTPGPIKIVNNYLEGAGENVMFGGATASYSGSIPSDVEIRRNYFYKPLSWLGQGYVVKNSLEFKNAQRVLVEGNVFENCWGGEGQTGFSIVITPRTESGAMSWAATRDITFRYNKLLNVEGGFNTLGVDAFADFNPVERVTVKHNFIKQSYAGTGDHKMFQMNGGTGNAPKTFEITNNTGIISNNESSYVITDAASSKITGFVFRDNIVSEGTYGFFGVGGTSGSNALSAHYTSPTFSYNVIIGGSSGNYTGLTGCQFPANNAAVSFTDSASDDYSLAGGSAYKNDGSDGNDPGADWTALNSATQYATTGQWGSEHATYSDHTYTNAELPRSYVDTTYSNQTGNTWTVTNSSGSSVAGTGTGNRTGCSLAYALANCAIGDIIEVDNSLTITGSFTLRAI